MEIDEEIAQETGRGATPTIANKRQWYKKTPGGQDSPTCQERDNTGEREVDMTVEVDKLANTKTLVRVLTVAEKPAVGKGSNAFGDPLNKYTKGQMPPIYDEDLATLLARIDPIQIGSWLALPTRKVLARQFNLNVRYKPNHQHIAQALAAAAREIMGMTSVAVAPSNKDPTLPKRESQPYTFLIHDILKEDKRALLEREVWLSKELTFQVTSIYIKCPEF